MHSQGNWAGIRRMYDDAMVAMCFGVGMFVVLIAGLNDRILMIWLGRSIPEIGPILMILLMSYSMALLLTGPGSSVCKGIGIVRIETVYIMVGLLLNVMMKIMLVPRLGAIGTVVSSAISWGLSAVVFVVSLHWQTQLPFASTAKALKTLAVIPVCVLFARWLAAWLPEGSTRASAIASSAAIGSLSGLLFTGTRHFDKDTPAGYLAESLAVDTFLLAESNGEGLT